MEKLTTIAVKEKTKKKLEGMKAYPKQSFDEVITRFIQADQDTMSDQERRDIDIALKEIREGKTKSLEQVAKDMGISLK